MESRRAEPVPLILVFRVHQMLLRLAGCCPVVDVPIVMPDAPSVKPDKCVMRGKTAVEGAACRMATKRNTPRSASF